MRSGTAAGSAAFASAGPKAASCARSPTAAPGSTIRSPATPRRAGRGIPLGLWSARQLTQRLDLLSSQSGLTVRLWV